jgi:hypothetical protein
MIDAGQIVHQSSETPFEGLQLAFENVHRWKELIIVSFPTDAALNSWNVTLCSPAELVRLEVLEISPGCRLLTEIMTFSDALTSLPLTRVHIFSSSVMIHLLFYYCSRPMFDHLADFHVDGRQLSEPADILPLFSCLQSLTAYYLPLPEYDVSVCLPLTQGLR